MGAANVTNAIVNRNLNQRHGNVGKGKQPQNRPQESNRRNETGFPGGTQDSNTGRNVLNAPGGTQALNRTNTPSGEPLWSEQLEERNDPHDDGWWDPLGLTPGLTPPPVDGPSNVNNATNNNNAAAGPSNTNQHLNV